MFEDGEDSLYVQQLANPTRGEAGVVVHVHIFKGQGVGGVVSAGAGCARPKGEASRWRCADN
jgi:hypothetical protein